MSMLRILLNKMIISISDDDAFECARIHFHQSNKIAEHMQNPPTTEGAMLFRCFANC